MDPNSIITCRICLLDETVKSSKMISPCKCNGSIRFVHAECLEAWLNSLSKSTSFYSCQICNRQFKTEQITKPLSEWDFAGPFFGLKIKTNYTYMIRGYFSIFVCIAYKYFFSHETINNNNKMLHRLVPGIFFAYAVYMIFLLCINYILKFYKYLVKVNSVIKIKNN